VVTQTQTVPDGAQELRKGFIVLGLMMAVSLAALEATIVGTVMPTIAGELGGLRLFSWVFSIYLLTSTVTVPIYGKLADLYGRKPVLLFGIGLFLIGSVLCGTAGSMEMLIAFRAVQGLGAGAVLPVSITVIGDIFSIEERARIQGFFSGVWGVTGIAGPAVGGLIADNLGWPWAFYLNLPFGALSLFVIAAYYGEKLERRRHSLDFLGAGLLSGAIVCLLMALLHGVDTYGWLGAETIGLLVASLVLLALFVRQERRAEEPLLPLTLFQNRVIAVSSAAIFVAGGVMFGVSSYVPLFEQGVFGGSATEAGLVLAPMSLAWVFGATVCGRLIIRVGYYPAALTGGIALFVGGLLLLGLTPDTTIWIGVLAGAVMGIGMGFVSNSTIIAVQNAVQWNQRGVATGSTMFFRTIGGSISIAIMGALLNSRLAERLSEIPNAPAGLRAETLLQRGEREALPASLVESVQTALGASLHEVFFIVFAAGALCLAIIAFFPRGRTSELAARPVEQPTAVSTAIQAREG
jgi:EmrB/QacA subfamily drug resistance transporter